MSDIQRADRSSVSDIPGPVLGTDVTKYYPYKEVYKFEAFGYLDTDEALPLFEKQADIIIEREYRTIIDVGCRIGRINDVLVERGHEYTYMGFDTSPDPIAAAQERWSSHPNIEYRVASWDNPDEISVDFDVDVVLFSGVLCYVPKTHKKLFRSLVVDLYAAEGAIIQDLRDDQRYMDDRIEVNYIMNELDRYTEYYKSVTKYDIDCNFRFGNRAIMDIRIYES